MRPASKKAGTNIRNSKNHNQSDLFIPADSVNKAVMQDPNMREIFNRSAVIQSNNDF